MVIEITSLAQFEQAISSKPTVVDFTATWCGPCKMIKPTYHKFAETYKTVQFLQVDVDENEDITSKYGVSAMPTFLFFVGGKKVEELVGANQTKLEAMIKKHA